MKAFFFLAALFSLGQPARADILFFDLNFSPNEVVAARAAAEARGEQLRLYPARTAEQHRQIEKHYRLVDELSRKMRKCVDYSSNPCADLKRRYDEASAAMYSWMGQLKRVDGDELGRIFAELHQDGAQISTVIYSGHSGGTGSLGGFLGFLSVEALKPLFEQYPTLLSPIRTMLLWGCYGGTLHSLNAVWRAQFPSISIWGGFEKQSPLGIRDSSGRFLKSMLMNESRLRAGRNIREVHKIFRGLDLVAELDGTAVVGDSYFTYDQADSIDSMLKRCASFDGRLMERFTCFDQGLPGCENPPPDHRGELRELYSFLQVNRHCRDQLVPNYPDLPSVEYLIRLIFLDNVKANFASHHRSRFAAYNGRLKDLGFKENGRLENFARSTRQQDVAVFKEKSEHAGSFGYRDYSVASDPKWHDMLAMSHSITALVNMIGNSAGNRSSSGSCVPFSWVEPNANEKDSCMFDESLSNPLGPNVGRWVMAQYFNFRYEAFLHENPWALWVQAESFDGIKDVAVAAMGQMIDYLGALPDPTALEAQRLEKWRAARAEAQGQDGRAIAGKMLAAFLQLQEFLTKDHERAKGMPNTADAIWYLNYRLTDNLPPQISALRKLLGQ